LKKGNWLFLTGITVLLAAVILSLFTGCAKKSQAGPEERVLHGAPGIYPPPPQGHFNIYITNNIYIGFYADLIEQTLALYNWPEDKWVPMLATDWSLDTANSRFIVHLRKGVKFHDGTEFTSKDVVSSFYIAYLMRLAVWQYLDKVEAIDPYTVAFHCNHPSTAVDRYILRVTYMTPDSVYGKFSREVQTWADEEIYLKGLKEKQDKGEQIPISAAELEKRMKKVAALRAKTMDKFLSFRPDKRIGTGPFTMDIKDVNESQITLRRFPGYWDSSKIHFDKVVLYNGETPTITPMLLAKEIDFASHGFPIATERKLRESGFRIMHPPTYGGAAIAFNFDVSPLNRKEVRQAIAYAINRDEVAAVTLGDAAKASKYVTGFSDTLVPRWMKPDYTKMLNPYAYDTVKAAKILESIGFKRGRDGFWMDDKGKRIKLTLLCILEYADFASAGENVSVQLKKFGIDAPMRAVTAAQFPDDANQGRFDMMIRVWGAGHPHPHFSLYNDLITYNYPSKVGKGMNFPMKQNIAPWGNMDLEVMTRSAAEGFDIEKQKDMVGKVAVAINQLLPVLTLYERYGNSPLLEGVRIAPLPKESPYYSNQLYLDNFLVMKLLDGSLYPATHAKAAGGNR
jgi:peptide/nickel transport system substrate-binding protein